MDTADRQTNLAEKNDFISCVVPVFNEQEVISTFIRALHDKLSSLSNRFEIIMVDDGSSDDTASQFIELAKIIEVKSLCFSRNFGKELALTAGLEHCSGEVTILIDCDFQHPLDVLPEFLQKWSEGQF